MTNEELKILWFDLVTRNKTKHPDLESLWNEIEDHYSAEGRYYHTLDHLMHMISNLHQYNGEVEDPDIVLFSIFYHDIIYDPLAGDNEEQSALLAKKRLEGMGISANRISHCYNQIMATRDHISTGENDTNVFLDLDLAVLGESSDIYQKNAEKIRKEYKLLPGFVFRNRRNKMLTEFYNMDPIFQTREFRHKLEDKAKENLRADLDL